VKKSLFHFSSFKVKKVKSESDYFSRSNVWVCVLGMGMGFFEYLGMSFG